MEAEDVTQARRVRTFTPTESYFCSWRKSSHPAINALFAKRSLPLPTMNPLTFPAFAFPAFGIPFAAPTTNGLPFVCDPRHELAKKACKGSLISVLTTPAADFGPAQPTYNRLLMPLTNDSH